MVCKPEYRLQRDDEMMIQIMALKYNSEWCSVESEEQMHKNRTWGMPHDVGSAV